MATIDGGRGARARARERSAGRPPVASVLLRLCVKGLALGLKGKVENEVVKPSERSKGLHWDENARSDNSKVWLWD